MKFAYLSWEAFAALSAVLAALGVGWRQVGITQRQVKISGEIARLESLKLRTELYDRRLETLAHIDNWLRWTCQHGKAPTQSSGVEAAQLGDLFASAVVTSQFLFRQEVHEAAERYRKLGIDLHYHSSSLKDVSEASNYELHSQKTTAIKSELGRALLDFPKLVKPEMNLGEAGTIQPKTRTIDEKCSK